MRRGPNGFTLLELLVAMGLLGLLSLAVLNSYMGATKAVDAGIGRIELQQRARTTLDRLGPILMSAVPAPTVPGLGQAIYLPADPGPTIFFATTEDLLSENYPQGNTSAMEWAPTPPSELTPPLYYYRITWDGTELTLQKMQEDLSTEVIPPPAQVLARTTTGDDLVVDRVDFRMVSGAVHVTVAVRTEVRGATGQAREIDYELTTVILPAFKATNF